MKRDKIRLYILQIVLIFILLIFLFSTKLLVNKIIISIFVFAYSLIVKKTINSVKTNSIYYKEVSKYMLIFSLLYISIYYIIGLYAGYYKATYQFSIWTLLNQILPIILIIISSELLRKEFLSFDTRFSRIMIFIYGIIIDLIIYTNIYNLDNYKGFFDSLGYVFFASISGTLLYNYISKKFGIKPNIIYRIITTIYLYIIPITPDIHMYFKAFARIVYPIMIILVIQDSYEKNKKILEIKNKTIRRIITILLLLFIMFFTMIISCRFRFGLMVVGSSSMYNTIEKGDAVIYDSKYSPLNVGEIILFKKNDIIIIHRVVKIENTNDEVRIFTKGDNNLQVDSGYTTIENVKGKVKFKIKKIGFPTIWVNELFK